MPWDLSKRSVKDVKDVSIFYFHIASIVQIFFKQNTTTKKTFIEMFKMNLYRTFNLKGENNPNKEIILMLY